MTTIVYRDGVLASDSRAYSGDSGPIGFKKKIHRLSNGALLGISSSKVGLPEAIVRWFESEGEDHPGDKFEELHFQALLITPDGEVYYYHDSLAPSGPLHGQFHAIGTGDQYALGAMTCGATADAAVMVAMQHDVWTGGELLKLELHPAADQPVEPEVLEGEILDPIEPVRAKPRKKKAA